uniref:Tc1-like transposase DDE domain-containing protein n=1 Tax=Cyprinus carpio TaxID=7962 RepID=A0A8C1RMJ9_CYPCA
MSVTKKYIWCNSKRPGSNPFACFLSVLLRICTQFLEAENILVLARPAYSTDMSPIEHVWDALDWHTCAIIVLPNQHLDMPHL